ncbi:MAG: carbohydrate kinase family protein [Patescibacteria group bacterium]
MKNIDILAIGDTVVDAFIRLNDAEVLKNSKGEDMLAVRYGDKVPFESVEVCNAVGNSANAAVSASKLGLNSALLSYVGGDQNGKDCLAELQKKGVNTDYIRIDGDKKTNYHYVLWYKMDRTILIKHEEFNYSLDEVESPKWIYLSSLGENSLPFHMEIVDFLEKNPEVKLSFQPGTFQIKLGKDVLEKIYKNTEIFFCNVEEAQHILNESTRDLPTLLKAFANLGPKIVIITDGFAGAYGYNTRENKMFFMPVYPHTPIERTGAGDAFASTIVSALALGESLETAMTWAPLNSMSVVQQVGAQKGLLTMEQIRDYLAKAPESYKIQQI